jgi:hypothetical protein
MVDDTRPHTIYADCPSSEAAFEGYDVIRHGQANPHTVISSDTTEMVREAVLDVREWLPFASEVYKISADIKDYVMVPVVVMISDLPNRNLVAFPYTELTRFNPTAGVVAYKTWRGKGCYQEHANQILEDAKGVILDAAMRPLTNYHGDFWKVQLLLSFDRSKDPILANSILTRELSSFSMGALCSNYSCSICDKLVSKGGCEHVELHKPVMNIYNQNLAYLQAIDPLGFETSAVKIPAYHYAQNPEYLVLS